MLDLKICLHSFSEINEVNDEMKTLEQMGIEGKPMYDPDEIPTGGEDGGLPVIQIFYDFKPADFSDPVLLYLPTSK